MRSSKNFTWRRTRTVAAAGLFAMAIGAGTACRSSTQVTLTIHTPLDCTKVKGVAITAGAPGAIEDVDPNSVTYTCEGGSIGTVVIVPSDSPEARASVKVVLGYDIDVGQCTAEDDYAAGPPPEKGCIVARRSFNFIEYGGFFLPIDLRSDCLGKACGPAETCFKGACVPADVDLEKQGCATPGACVDDSLFGAGGSVVQGLDSESPWPTYRGGNRRNGRGKGVLPSVKPKNLWSAKFEVSSRGGVTLGKDGTAYFSSGDTGKVRAIASDGTVLWTADYPNIGGPAVLADGTLLLSNGRILSANTGKVVADLGVAQASQPALVAPDGTKIFVAKSKVLAFSEHGDWAVDGGGELVAAALADGSDELYVSNGVALRALALADGKILGEWPLAGGSLNATLPPAIADDGTLVAGGKANGLGAVLLVSGATATSLPLTTQSFASTPSLGRVGGKDIGVFCAGRVHQLDLAGATTKMSGGLICNAPNAASVVDAEGTALQPTAVGSLVAVASSSLNPRWELVMAGGGYSGLEPAIGLDGTVYVVEKDGALRAYR